MTRRAWFFISSAFFIIFPVSAAEESWKLPYTAGVSMLVSRGYETPATHVNKDKFALDFVQSGCNSFGSPVRAVSSGVVSFVNNRDTWGGGYGKNVVLDHDEGKVSRYAHLSDYVAGLVKGKEIIQGEIIGYQGNTGNVIGKVCQEHPGTHLHVSTLKDNQPMKPEPMSNYATFVAGHWYTSDNIFPPPTSTLLVGQFIPSQVSLVIPEHATMAMIRVVVKNSGVSPWEAGAVSVNVVGGVFANIPFVHPSWKTALRPLIITKKVPSQSATDIVFPVSVPEYISDYTIRFQLVFQNEKEFSRIDKQFLSVRFEREHLPVKEVVTPIVHTGSIAEIFSKPDTPLYIPEVHSGGAGVFSSPFIEVAHAASSPQVQTVQATTSTLVLPLAETVDLTTTTPANTMTTSTLIQTELMIIATSTISVNQEEISTSAVAESSVTTTISVSTSTESIFAPIEIEATADKQEKISIHCGSKDQSTEKTVMISSSSSFNVLLADGKDHIMLNKVGSPYFFDGEVLVKKNQSVIIEEGVTLFAKNAKSSLLVEGILSARGTVSSSVRFTSVCADAAASGDWSGIRIRSGGEVNLEHTNISFAGAPYTISYGALASSDLVSRVIDNQGGTLVLTQVQIENSYEKTSNEQLNALIWIENSEQSEATFSSEYSLYSGGFAAIRVQGKNTGQRIKGMISNNTFTGFVSPTGPIHIERDWLLLRKNTFEKNKFNGVYLQSVEIIDDVEFEANGVYLVSGVTVHKLGSLTVPEGVVFRMLPGTDIVIDGELRVLGTESNSVTFLPDSSTWGALVFSGAKGKIIHADISGGGLSQTIPSGQSRMIHAVNSGVSFGHVHLHDSRVPGALIGGETSLIDISQSRLSWESLPSVSSWVTYGIYLDGGALSVDVVDFKNVKVPIYASAGTVVKETDDGGGDIEDITEAV